MSRQFVLYEMSEMCTEAETPLVQAVATQIGTVKLPFCRNSDSFFNVTSSSTPDDQHAMKFSSGAGQRIRGSAFWKLRRTLTGVIWAHSPYIAKLLICNIFPFDCVSSAPSIVLLLQKAVLSSRPYARLLELSSNKCTACSLVLFESSMHNIL